MPEATSFGESHDIQDIGPSLQQSVPASVHNLPLNPSTIPANGTVTSNLILSDGFKTLGVGLTLSQTGTLAIQRYLDDAGLVPQGSPVTLSLVASNAANLNITDGLPFASFSVSVINGSGASTAVITNFAILMQA